MNIPSHNFSTRRLFIWLSVLFVFVPWFACAQTFGNQPSSTPAQKESSLDQKTPANIQLKPVQTGNVMNSSSQTSPEIRLYMRDFKVSRTLTGRITCSMRFYASSTMNTTISNLSYRLKWDNMETPLSFANIEPNHTFYRDYALLGNGCYNMDKTPNIIVNRCRIKGLTQQQCADAIQWVK